MVTREVVGAGSTAQESQAEETVVERTSFGFSHYDLVDNEDVRGRAHFKG